MKRGGRFQGRRKKVLKNRREGKGGSLCVRSKADRDAVKAASQMEGKESRERSEVQVTRKGTKEKTVKAKGNRRVGSRSWGSKHKP